MKVLILGVDGYLGWSLANYLATDSNYAIYGIDNLVRRRWVKEMRSISATPVPSIQQRLKSFESFHNKSLQFSKGDITNYTFLSSQIKLIEPDVIVDFAQCPSAPYSMMNRDKCVAVQTDNLVGTLNLIYAMRDHAPNAHLVKLGTMGEYGTPNIDIPEGFFEIEYKGRKDRLPFPKQANSWYHLTKVHDSNNLQFACRNYGIRCTDIMQGIVFGLDPAAERNLPANLQTRMDFDEAFGTVINRFCVEAVTDHAITVYGEGGQTRSFLPIRDSMRCIQLVIENAIPAGEYRVVNQFANIQTIQGLAEKVVTACQRAHMDVSIAHINNPRKERASHYYQPENQNLKNLGYEPTTEVEEEIFALLQALKPHKKRMAKYRDIFAPSIQW